MRSKGLDWRLIAVHADGIAGTMSLCISAEERQDVKDFARELGRRLSMRTLVRQIGRRDTAKVMTGLGRCGREFCCSSFLTDYPATNIRMAKDQNLALSPDSTQGQCGGTLCCLAYEHSDYLERGEWLPKMGKKARSIEGLEGRVVGVNALQMTFTLLDPRRRRHVLPATAWEGNRGKDIPAADAIPTGTPCKERE
jgi:cell fate regulator YaaT (PSP1 superfamily)